MACYRLLPLAITVFALLAACSQPRGIQELKPQFGTKNGDFGSDIAASQDGGAYLLSRQVGPSPSPYAVNYSRVLFHAYDKNGNQSWWREVAYTDGGDADSPQSVGASTVQRANLGNSYILFSRGGNLLDYRRDFTYIVHRYSRGGNLIASFAIGTTRENWASGSPPLGTPDIAVDSAGNVYAVIQDTKLNENNDLEWTTINVLRKYSPFGVLLWEQPSSVGTPTGVAVTTNDIVYVLGRGGLARHTSTGAVVWKKPGYFYNVTASGTSVYTSNKNNIFAFDSNGQQKWTRFMTLLDNPIIQDLSGDADGNLYVSGKSFISGDNWNAFVRKFNASGGVQWARSYGTPAFDDATGVSTLNGNDIFVSGVTLGSLAHPNRGAEDGYVRKLNASGYPVWTQ